MKGQTSKPVVLHEGQGDATWFIGTLMTRKAGTTDGNGNVAFLDQLAPAGFGPPLHLHHVLVRRIVFDVLPVVWVHCISLFIRSILDAYLRLNRAR